MSSNGEHSNPLEATLRFLGLATGQRRGERPSSQASPRPPSPEEVKAAELGRMLQQNADGSAVLLELITARISEANASAHEMAANHAICVGFLGAEAALKRLLDDLTRLRG